MKANRLIGVSAGALGLCMSLVAALSARGDDPCCKAEASAKPTAIPSETKRAPMHLFMKSSTAPSPIACRLTDADKQARREEITQSLFHAVSGVKELNDGYELKLPGDGEWPKRVFEFVESERRCCPFFRFEVALEPDEGPIRLSLRGRPGVKEFIGANMLPKSAPPTASKK